MNSYYIVWSNYDGHYLECYNDEDQCLTNVATIQGLHEQKNNGTSEPVVIYGQKKEFEPINVTTKIKWK